MKIFTLAAFVGLVILPGPAKAGHYVLQTVLHAQDAHATFTVGTAKATRGQKAYGVMKVPAGSDAGYDIPVAVLHGAKPGPVLAIVSGAHGTEYASILAVEALIDAVKPADLSGILILVPMVNVLSFEKLFYLSGICFLCVLPLVFLLRAAPGGEKIDAHVEM